MTQGYIYNLQDPETRAVRYVGRTVRPDGRYADHGRPRLTDKTHRACWIRSILARGQRPIFTIIDTCDAEMAYEREQFWIAYYRASGCRLTNLSDGGPGLINPPAEVRKRKSDSLMGHAVTDRTRAAVSLAHKGIPLSAEHRANMSKALKGKPHKDKGLRHLSDERKRQISESLIGNQYRKGIPHTQETRDKMSKANKGKPKSDAHKAAISAGHARRKARLALENAG